MKRTALLLLLAAGCAHAPSVDVARTETAVATDTVHVVREAVRAELLGTVTTASTEYKLFVALNGEPVKIGVLTTSGSSVTQATTAVPFTLTTTDCPSRILLFQCDAADANVGAGATCATTVTSADHKKQIATAWEPYYLMLHTSTSICLDAAAATTINCAVFCMK